MFWMMQTFKICRNYKTVKWKNRNMNILMKKIYWKAKNNRKLNQVINYKYRKKRSQYKYRIYKEY